MRTRRQQLQLLLLLLPCALKAVAVIFFSLSQLYTNPFNCCHTMERRKHQAPVWLCVCVGGRMRSKERGRNQCWPGVSTPHTYTTAIGRSFDIGILYFFFKGKTDRLYTEKLKIKLTASRKQHYTVDLIYK